MSRIAELAAVIAARRIRIADWHVSSLLIFPYLRHVLGRPGHVVDIGACHGAISEPFLAAGWTADLIEADPRCQQKLRDRVVARHDGRARLHAVAASDGLEASVAFHRAAVEGLSGFAPSPYGATVEVIHVDAVHTGTLLATAGTERVDFLKIDAEGHDCRILGAYDFSRLPPRVAMVEAFSELGDNSPEGIARSIELMRDNGYDAAVFSCEDEGTFRQGIWDRCWLAAVHMIGGSGAVPRWDPLKANVVFYRRDDAAELVPRLAGFLDGFLRA